MKRKLFVVLLLVVTTITTFAQKIDYTTYDVVAQKGNVSVVVKDNDWKMIIGSLKKPKQVFLLGYSKEQATSKIDRIIEIGSNENCIKKDRNVSFCGIPLQLTITGSGDNEKYLFVSDNKHKFSLTKKDCLDIKQSIKKYTSN